MTAEFDALTDEQKSSMDTELRNIVQTGVKSIFLPIVVWLSPHSVKPKPTNFAVVSA